MESRLTSLHELKPQTKTWTVKVQVMEKCFPHSSQSSRLYQRLILRDSEGTRIQATIFGSDIELFRDTFKEYNKYMISNAIVRYILPIHRIVPNDTQWIINGATLVEEATNGNDDQNTELNFTPFTEIPSHIGQDSTIALQISEPRYITTRNGDTTIQEILLATDELKPMRLTLCDQFTDNEGTAISEIIHTWPVIIGTRIKVTAFNGTSLSTKASSYLMINAEIPETTKLRAWCMEHEEKLTNLIRETSTQHTHNNNAAPSSENVRTIQAANTVDNMETFWIKAAACIANLTQKFWYVGCDKCHKAINIECGRVYKCIHCNQANATAEPRCRFDIDRRDESGSLTANCFGKHAENLFPFTAASLKEHTNEDGVTDKAFLELSLTSSTRLFLIKPYNFHTRIGGAQRRLTIMFIKEQPATNSPTPTQ